VIWGGRLVLSDKDYYRSLFPNIAIHYLGAPLAYNLIIDDGSVAPGKWGIEVLSRVKDAKGVTAVCLCFGEIDIRTRAVKMALESGISLTESVQRIADRLVAFCDLLRKECPHPIFVAAPIPSPHGKAWDSLFPSYGSEKERNQATRLFAQYLQAKSRELKSFHVISVFDRLVDCTLKTRSEFYADEIHLNTMGLDLIVEEFRRVVREQSLPLVDYWDPGGILGEPSARDVSKEIAFKLEATDQTNTVLIDIGYGAFPRTLKLLGLKFDAPRLLVSVSGGLSTKRMAPIREYEVVPLPDRGLDFAMEFPDDFSCRFLELAFESSIKVSLDDIRLDVKSLLKQ
jgi:hypothetical protein